MKQLIYMQRTHQSLKANYNRNIKELLYATYVIDIKFNIIHFALTYIEPRLH